MSLSPKKESESNEENSNICNSDEPKISLEQRSLVDPSTELGSKIFYIILLAGINELTRTDIFHNSESAFRLNSSYIIYYPIHFSHKEDFL